MRQLFCALLTVILCFVMLPVNALAASFIYPVRYDYISSYFNPPHNGVDFATACGTPIYASHGGSITYAAHGWNDGYGGLVKINDGEDEAWYAHMQYITYW